MGIFDITNKKTWEYASQTERMTWKGDVFTDIDTGKPISELAMMNFMVESDIKIMGSTTVEKKHKYGDKKIITYIMDNLAGGVDPDKILTDVIKDINNAGIFDIFNFDFWEFAGDKPFLWNGKKLVKKDNNPFTEKDTVDLVPVIFKFLERKGDIIPHDEKIKAIKNLLNRMENPEYYAQQYEQEQAEIDNAIPDDKFNPRNPETYKFAKNKQLEIDGKKIWKPMYSNGKKIKSPVSENEFLWILKTFWKHHCVNEKAWDMATMKLQEEIKKEYYEKGIIQNKDSVENKEKANNYYQEYIKQLSDTVPQEIDTDFIEDRIYSYFWDMDHRKSIHRH